MRKIYKKTIRKFIKKTDLLDDLKTSLLNFNFVMIYVIGKMLLSLKNHLKYVKDFFKEIYFTFILLLYFFLKKKVFHNITMESLSLEE